MKQKVIKIGSSIGITIPKESLRILGLKVGDFVETDTSGQSLVVKPEPKATTHGIDPQILQWGDEFIVKNRELLKRLKDK